jgi:hypothetical protein
MTSARILAMSIASVMMSASLLSAQDLSRYRGFQLGMSVDTVARQAGISAEGRVLHRRPGLVQELIWYPTRIGGSSPQAESVRKVAFSFHNGQLFRILVNYDRDRTEGLTAEDVVEALSATYGLRNLPTTGISPSLARPSEGGDAILAHWEDPQYAADLSSSYLSTFALTVFSKPLDALARADVVEAIRLDEQEAPQRAVEREQQQTEAARVKQEAARRLNKTAFRP